MCRCCFVKGEEQNNSVLVAGVPSVDGESISGTYMGSIANGVAGMFVISHINSTSTD